ncbi:MAG TPA: hypothetical protein RMH85_34455 [Polyangiaceae bacterium LLY-WYZ-15_(1-7)]|nr:hypothetical protein [Sandaracinus sp.]HJK89890.1 hypothetical protein [Polyangiaceae bacterium LLY-WYZ-15_(1-7)]MBJ72694.1 hypothetical protein [Sandaracinus sp.]HJL02974.1 hypothetical protein [Polyangiaceae bacterium LLY-WYZ-15_(1-7)]HJL13638.1 hypothetical protein [Polyangiaceae bacterium LLY-WYZ-15_(1-7)]
MACAESLGAPEDRPTSRRRTATGSPAALVLGATLLSLLGLATPPASAQTRDATRERARQAYQAGLEAAEQGLWADALEQFEEAYALTGSPVALQNVGLVLRSLGRHREARDVFARLVREHPDDPSTEENTRLRDEQAARVAVLTLVGLDPEAPHRVRLDGEVRAEAAEGPELEVEADPGRRVLIVDREGYRPYEWAGVLEDGERQRLRVTLEAMEMPDDRRRVRRALITVGTILLVGAAALATGLVLRNRSQLDPETSNVRAL